jgi:CRP-like cAMP-binding protein
MENPTNLIIKSSFWSNLFKAPTEKSDLEEVLHSMPPFTDMDSKHFKFLMKIIHNRVYEPGEYIFSQGDPGIGLYIIREGEVVVKYKSEEEQELELVRFQRGDFFGELAMLNDDVRSASATATKETKVAVIFKPDLDEFIEKYPTKGISILRGISQIIALRLRILNDDYVTLYCNHIANKEEF